MLKCNSNSTRARKGSKPVPLPVMLMAMMSGAQFVQISYMPDKVV